MSVDYPLTIKCGDHKQAPWAVVCVHLLEGTSREWISIRSTHPEVEFDWACPKCLPKEDVSLVFDDLRPICIHCVQRLRKMYDVNFKEFDDEIQGDFKKYKRKTRRQS